jgi:hypothetical protein
MVILIVLGTITVLFGLTYTEEDHLEVEAALARMKRAKERERIKRRNEYEKEIRGY